MSNHSNFAAGRFMGCDPKHQKAEQWEKLGEIISENGPTKTGEQLQRVIH